MLKLKNHEAVLEALIEQLKEFEADKNRYETDVYLYVKDGNGTVDTFTNVGGNSWLDDDHFTIYTDKSHHETMLDELVDGVSYGWIIEELECVYELSGLKEKAYEDLTADMDEDEKENISSFDDLESYEVERWLNKNYSSEIEQYYKERFIPDCCMDGISESADHVLDEFENEYSYVVINDGKFCSEYSDYDEAVKAAEELGEDAEVDIWNDYDIFNAKSFGE